VDIRPPAGQSDLAAYTANLVEEKVTPDDLRQALLRSPDFAATPPVRWTEIDIGDGIKVVVDPEEPEFGRHIVASGGWEPHIGRVIRSSLRAGDTVVDVGGNVGVMSFQAAATVGRTGKVIAFEPNLTNVGAFRRGMLANGFDNVLLYPFALSDRFHLIEMSMASNAKVVGAPDVGQQADVIQAIPADEVLLKERRIDFVKLDIEGFELNALRGMAKALAKHRPKILCEFNPLCLHHQGRIEPRILAEFLFDLCRAGRIVEHDGSFTPVASAEELMRLWTERDAWASTEGILPPGWVHFDLLFDLGGRRRLFG
jgi:FkbM family methyltransferase